MFGFDERYAMFDVTAVDNQFILEYLPSASGDQVKVYLYGLMLCCHPQSDMTMDQLAKEVGMTEESVQAAYRYWERRGLVQRISDHPPVYRYVNVKQLTLSGIPQTSDPSYEAFSEAVYAVFDNERKLHGADVQLCYEWVEEMGLPQEVVIALLQHMKEVRGKKFSFKAAQKLATELADRKIATAEDAAYYLQLEKNVLHGSKEVLQRMGQYREPTLDEQNLYRTWITDWGFTHEAVLEACADTTGGRPSFKYLNGILKKYRERSAAASAAELRQNRDSSRDAVQSLKKVLGIMNLPTLTINDMTKEKFAQMQELYTDDVILMAASECAGRGLDFDDVLKTLRSWKRQGLNDRAAILDSLRQVNQQNGFLAQLFDLWGRRNRPAAGDRKLLGKWMGEWGFSEEMIAATAAYAANADKPMLYLDKLLEDFQQKNIKTPEQIAAQRVEQQRAAQAVQKPVKTVREQQYTQREYVHSDDELNQMMAQWKESQSHAE